ncbi:hypothetical protein BB560_002972 [Smittium megazygosporum]|uniref:Tyrosine specific protein phosphatases domain-containing protein n=1 Tax=Smittium megazygosporum TaxID=133381 RepID=A0A2T9ZDB4_9FUNG|nr:hypothetical protein BB560_002972 [Smittium megazygosporum]
MALASHQNLAGPRRHVGKNVTPLANSFSLVEMNDHLRFLIMDCPTDGTISLYLKPPQSVVTSWLQLVVRRETEAVKLIQNQPVPTTIAVHCVAGLGRAPVLVAIALTESGKDPVAVIDLIRRKRRGAFNNKQITYLVNYKRSSNSKSLLALRKANGFNSNSQKVSEASLASASSGQNKDGNYKSFFKKVFGGLN